MPTRGEHRTTCVRRSTHGSPQTLISGGDLFGSTDQISKADQGLDSRNIHPNFLFVTFFFLLVGGWFFEPNPPNITWVEIPMVEFGLSQNSCWIESILHHLIGDIFI